MKIENLKGSLKALIVIVAALAIATTSFCWKEYTCNVNFLIS